MSEQIASEVMASQTTHLVMMPDPFRSEAGMIQNLLEGECGGVGVIMSKQGATRANHWHRTDWHYLHVISGSFVCLFRPVGSDADPSRITVSTGQTLFTPPNEEHALWFREDTVMVSMSRLSRTHESHEGDVVRLSTPLLKPSGARR